MRIQSKSGTVATGLVLVLFALSWRGVAAEVENSRYRVRGNLLPVAGGGVAGTTVKLYQIVGQPSPFGESEGGGARILHGWRIPPIVALLYRYALQAGWGLHGSPGVSDQTIGEIFTGPGGAPIKIGAVQYASVTGDTVEALESDPLIANLAFWVFSYWGGSGTEFDTPDAARPDDGTSWIDALGDGWNLYSPPYHVSVPDSGRIAVVWRWNPVPGTYQFMGPGTIMRPLEGYWVFTNPDER